MAELENELKRNEEVVVDNTDYIDAIKELKQNSVDKDKYDALKAENKKLLEAMINGTELQSQSAEKLDSRLEYYKKYKENKFNNDLEYWENFLNLRKATMKEYGADPCVTGNYGLTPEGGRANAAYGEAETVQEQMEMIEDFVKEANGNPLIFETLLQSAMPKR